MLSSTSANPSHYKTKLCWVMSDLVTVFINEFSISVLTTATQALIGSNARMKSNVVSAWYETTVASLLSVYQLSLPRETPLLPISPTLRAMADAVDGSVFRYLWLAVYYTWTSSHFQCRCVFDIKCVALTIIDSIRSIDAKSKTYSDNTCFIFSRNFASTRKKDNKINGKSNVC